MVTSVPPAEGSWGLLVSTVTVAGLAVAVGVVGMTHLEAESDVLTFFPDDHPLVRAYRDVVIECSPDKSFSSGRTIVFNNDHDNSSGFGKGPDKAYIETNKGKLIGQLRLLPLQKPWSMRMPLETAGKPRDPALFNLAVNTKLRACKLPDPRVSDVASNGELQSRAIIRQRKQRLLGHSKLDDTVRNLGIEIDAALEMSKQVDVR